MSEPTQIDLALAMSDKNRRPFKKGGVWINLPGHTPNGKIYAIDRESGTLIALDRRQDFSPKLHKRWNPEDGTPVDKHHDEAGEYLSPAAAREQQEDRKQAEMDVILKTEKAKEEEVPQLTPEPQEAPEQTESTDPEARWKELKDVGFANLKGEQRKEYIALKAVYGD